jgi:hypothetical protein
MNKIFSLLTALLVFLVLIISACKKTDEPFQTKCPGDDLTYTDTSLYISFRRDGVYRKYHQLYPNRFSGPGIYSIYYGISVTICRNSYQVYFLESRSKTRLLSSSTDGDVCLTFHKSQQTISGDMNSVTIAADKIFPSALNVSEAEGNFDAWQTDPMDGYSLDINENGIEKYYSTNNVFAYYKRYSQAASIPTYFSGTSFNVTSVESLCGNCYLIEGTFSTKLLKKSDSPQDFVTTNLTEGKFRIMRRI